MEARLPRSLPTNPIFASISTPLRLLANHPDQDFAQFIVRGIREGFPIGVDPTASFVSARRNMSSALENPQVIEEYLSKEVTAGNIFGPFSPSALPEVHINRFGVIPKKHQPGRWHLITELSHHEGTSVNDAIDCALCSLTYTTVDEVAVTATALGQGAQLAKIDIKSAYRLVPVHPAQRKWLGMQWQGRVYVDGMLPFSLRSAPKLFNAVADALKWCVTKRGVQHIYHYLDNFIVLCSPGTEECGAYLSTLQQVCQELGVPLAPEKQDGPAEVLTSLGIEIDTIRQELRLPAKKAGKIATDGGRMGQPKGVYQERIRVLHWHPAACMQGNTSSSQLPSPSYLAAQHHKAATSSYTSKCRIQIGRKVEEGIRSSLEWYGNHGDITAGFFPADLRCLRILGFIVGHGMPPTGFR